MRTFVGVVAGGAIALVIYKILAALLFPFLGMFIGLAAMAVKLVLIAAVVYFVYTLFLKRRREQTEA